MAGDEAATPPHDGGQEGEVEVERCDDESCEASFLEEAAELSHLVALLVPSAAADTAAQLSAGVDGFGVVQGGLSNLGIADVKEGIQKPAEGQLRDDPRVALLLRFESICAKYREQAELLDPHLDALLAPAVACLSRHALAAAAALPTALKDGSAGDSSNLGGMAEGEARRMVAEVTGAACVVQVVAYARGGKVVCRFMPNAPSDLEPALALLLLFQLIAPTPPDGRSEAPVAFEAVQQWRVHYSLLSWLSHLLLLPFSLPSLDSQLFSPLTLHAPNHSMAPSPRPETSTAAAPVPAAASTAPAHVPTPLIHHLLPLPTSSWEGNFSEGLSLSDVLLRVCLSFLPNRRLPAPLMLARLLSRPEMATSLSWFVGESVRLTASLSAAPGDGNDPSELSAAVSLGDELLANVVLTLAAVFKAAPRSVLVQHAAQVWTAILLPLLHPPTPTNATSSLPSAPLRLSLALVKLLHRLALSLLPPRLPSWRYQRDIHQVPPLPLPSSSAPAGGAGRISAERAEDAGAGVGDRSLAQREMEARGGEGGEGEGEAEEEEVPEVVEEAVGELLPMLKHKSTDVRWAAARGLSRVVGGLPAGMADEVVAAAMAMVEPSELPSDSAWQGVCLALAELAARGLLLPSRLQSVTPLLATALHYEVQRGAHGIGAHVRDAAAYVCWAIAHSFQPKTAAAVLQSLCPHLLAVACCDRQVGCRWAAAAAFQEVVGRFGCISDAHALATPTSRGTPHAAAASGNNGSNALDENRGEGVESGGGGLDEVWVPAGGIDIVNAADVTSLSSTRTAFTQVALFVAGYPEYREQLLLKLAACTRHWDPTIRSLAASSLASIASLDPPRLLSLLRLHLLPLLSSPDHPSRHGALLATAALLPPLATSPHLPLLQDTLSSLTSSLPRLLAARSFRGRLASDLKVAACQLLSALSCALPLLHLPLPAPALDAATACLHDMLGGDGSTLQCARARFVSTVQEAAAASLWDVARSQPNPACSHLARQIVTRHVATLEAASSTANARRGAVLALQAFLPSLERSWPSGNGAPGCCGDVGGEGEGRQNGGQEEGKGVVEGEGKGDEEVGGENEGPRREVSRGVVKVLCAAATDNRDRRGVTDVAVRVAAVEALGAAAALIRVLRDGGGDGRTRDKSGIEEEKGDGELTKGGLEGVGWWEGAVGGEGVVTALLRAAEDYTEDQRGDVGRLVREASMKALVVWVEEARRCCEEGRERVANDSLNGTAPHGRLREWCRAVAGRVVGVLLKQAGEKIDGTRQVAGQGLQRLLWGRVATAHGAKAVGPAGAAGPVGAVEGAEVRPLAEAGEVAATAETRGSGSVVEGEGGGGGTRRGIEGGKEGGSGVCMDVEGGGSGVCMDVEGGHQFRQHVPSDPHFNWMLPSAVFPRLAPLLLLPAYRRPLLSGLLLSAGSVSTPLAAAALNALQGVVGREGVGEGGGEGQWEVVSGAIAGDVMVLLRRHRKQSRVITPYIKAIAALLQAEFFGPLTAESTAPDKASFPLVLAECMEAELRRPHPTTSVPKMLAAVDLLAHLAAPHCCARLAALPTLLWLLSVPYATVRRHCAEQLYLVLLLETDREEDESWDTALEEASEILSGSDWAAMDDASAASQTDALKPLLEFVFS